MDPKKKRYTSSRPSKKQEPYQFNDRTFFSMEQEMRNLDRQFQERINDPKG